MTYVDLSYWQLLGASSLIFICALLSLGLRLNLERVLLLASLRMVGQLVVMGLVLKTLFEMVSLWFSLSAAVVMVLFAGREIMARQERRLLGKWAYGLGSTSMGVSALAVALLALVAFVEPSPWYHPRYLLPLLGMILGNTMTGISLGLSNLSTAAWKERSAIEARLALGATRTEAFREPVLAAIRTGFMPMINSMAAMGLVFIPGMMTGQVLAGMDPMAAVKYQLLIMFLIAGATGIGLVMAVMGMAWRLSDERHRLRLDRLGLRTGK